MSTTINKRDEISINLSNQAQLAFLAFIPLGQPGPRPRRNATRYMSRPAKTGDRFSK